MDQPSDPAGAVLDALRDLRRVLNAREWSENAGFRGDSAQIHTSWTQFETALERSAALIHSPQPGQGLASIWLKAIGWQAIVIEKALSDRHHDWQALLFYENHVLNSLLEAGWEKGTYILGFGRRKGRPIAKALLPAVSPIAKLRKLAARWHDEYPSDDAFDSPDWREKRDQYVKQTAEYLYEAVDQLEVDPGVKAKDEFCTNIVNNIDKPTHVVWPHLTNESTESLARLANWLSGTREPIDAPLTDTVQNIESDAAPADNQVLQQPHAFVDPPVAQSPSGALQLFGDEYPLRLAGTHHPPVSLPQYHVLVALCEAGQKGLSKEKLIKRSGHGGAREILRTLRDGPDPRWKLIISMAGTAGKGYRVL